jgi:hypothetical protein
VIEQGDQTPAAAVDAEVEGRANEAAAADAEPAAGDLEAVGGGPFEALELEGELGEGIRRCVGPRHRGAFIPILARPAA